MLKSPLLSIWRNSLEKEREPLGWGTELFENPCKKLEAWFVDLKSTFPMLSILSADAKSEYISPWEESKESVWEDVIDESSKIY